MKFGPVSLDECEGAVLAHSLKLEGRRIAKGSLLDAALIATLRKAGLTSVLCARPEKGDLSEDIAADRLAKHLTTQDVETSKAFTGRVNFKAGTLGIVRYNRQLLVQFNLVDEGVALSLVPHNQLVVAGQIIATLKIIPYFLSQAVLHKLEKMLQDTPLYTFHPLNPKRCWLIQTRSDALNDKVYRATETVTKNRLEQLGAQLVGASICDHHTSILTAEIEMARQNGAELILICGGTAIVDRQDIVPAAVERLGGHIHQLGLAVDPGNMLMAASWQELPILGMPGCARSPKLNGFDWVMHLLLAGVPLTRETLADLGAGGLLTEISSRPLPRAFAEKAQEIADETQPKIAAILLAAGRSRRMGKTNKLLMEIQGKAVVRHAAEALFKAGLTDVFVVTGYQEAAVRACLEGLPVQFLFNSEFSHGQASSVAHAISALPESYTDALIALGDMPLMAPAMIKGLCQHHSSGPFGGHHITLPTYGLAQQPDLVKRGNPTIWSRPFFADLMALTGDQGGRQILADYPAHIRHFHWPDSAPFEDVDNAESLQRVMKIFEKDKPAIKKGRR